VTEIAGLFFRFKSEEVAMKALEHSSPRLVQAQGDERPVFKRYEPGGSPRREGVWRAMPGRVIARDVVLGAHGRP
jgi:hypothetical protein